MLANVGYMYMLSKGCKSVTRDQINEWDMIAAIADAKEAVPKVVAETWLALAKRGCLPRWSLEQINEQVMEFAAL